MGRRPKIKGQNKATREAYESMRASLYQKEIAKVLGCSLADARLVEGYMRLEHPTLDGLSRAQFKAEAEIGLECVNQNRSEAEYLAKSYGL